MMDLLAEVVGSREGDLKSKKGGGDVYGMRFRDLGIEGT